MSGRIALEILPEGRTLRLGRGEVLSDALAASGRPLHLACGGRGLCGRCFVEIVAGPRPSERADEKLLRERRGLGESFRLACKLRLEAPVSVRIPESARLGTMSILGSGKSRSVDIDPAINKIYLNFEDPAISAPVSVLEGALNLWPKGRLICGLEALRDLASLREGSPGPVSAVVADGREILLFEPADACPGAYGLAIDLGTTTLAVELVDLETGAVLGSALGLNGQARYGADVVSRITAAFESKEAAEGLRLAAVDSLNGLISPLLASYGLAPDRVYETVVAGNTAMSHLLLGLPVGSLAVAPFHGAFAALPPVPASATGLAVHPRGRVYLAPNIRSFVGGDISAGLAAADLAGRPGAWLYVDLGTNGEIVLKRGRSLVCTSTAAGPAFEGSSIGCGLPAVAGAVDRVAWDEAAGRLSLSTVGGLPPCGLCGTGLVDLLASALGRGLLSPQGRILDPSGALAFAPGLALTQKDIREVQLAAAAIKTGMKMLLASRRLRPADLDGIAVAGAFGSFLDLGHAIALGLLPGVDPGRVEFLGNASLAGARALLVSRPERLACERLARRIGHLSLAAGQDFQATFADSLAFTPWS